MPNPFAKIFYNAFLHKFPKQTNKQTSEQNPREKKYITNFIKHLNNFFKSCADKEETPLYIDENNHNLSMKDIKDFANSLRAIMIAGSRYIPKLSSKITRDKNIISLFDNVSDLICKNSIKYDNIYDYSSFLIQNQNITEAPTASKEDTNIFFFGVSRDDIDKKSEALKNYNHFMKDIANIPEINNENIKLYNICFPTSYPEGIAVPEILGTINNPESYNEADSLFAQQYWHKYLGKDIKFDEDGNIIGGEKYPPEEFIRNLKKLKIFGYCAGAANAHRCIKAFKNLAEQIYSKEDVSKALKNIDFISFAFFPLEKNPDYSHTAIICNSKEESNPEAIIRCNFPELYEQFKITSKDIGKVKCSSYTEKDTILSLELPRIPVIYDENHHPISKEINNRNGHRLQNITAYNKLSPNFSTLRTIIKLSLLGNLNQNKLKKLAIVANTKNRGKIL